jgi:flagellar biosynthesis/type III secretory pathway protein FliH
MTAETRSEIKSVIESAVANQSKLLEERLRETLSRIESEKKESLSMESANKKRKNSETGDWDRKMREALDDLKAATAKILETKSEEHEKEFRDARDRGFYLGESVKKLELNTNEVLKSSKKTQTYLQSLEGNVNLLNETMRRVGIDDFRRHMFSGPQATIAGKSQ